MSAITRLVSICSANSYTDFYNALVPPDIQAGGTHTVGRNERVKVGVIDYDNQYNMRMIYKTPGEGSAVLKLA